MNAAIRTQLTDARTLAKEGQYRDARQALQRIDHPIAEKWLKQIDRRVKTELTSQPDYTTKAIVVIILYFVFYIPGLIANILWHNEGKRLEQITGHSIPGVGMLRVLRQAAFWILALPIFLIAMFVFILTFNIM